MKYGMEKYKFYTQTKPNGSTVVIAVSTYAERTVKGYAKCNPSDKFDLERGKKLAALRCALKIEKKRYLNATVKYMNAAREADEAARYYDKMKKYYIDTVDEIDSLQAELVELERKLG